MNVSFSYLPKEAESKAALIDQIFAEQRDVVTRGDFTLGKQVYEAEELFAKAVGAQYAVGCRSGTDALYLVMWALGIGHGDEVVTTANTFCATVGAIRQTGALPRLADVGDVQDMFLLPRPADGTPESRGPQLPVSTKLKAVIPVAWGGDVPAYPMHRIPLVANANPTVPYAVPFVVIDAAQAIGASHSGIPIGVMGKAACFSLHPLKNIHVWGDGGMVTTNDKTLADELRILLNHGLKDRDTWVRPGMNGRLETMQAVVLKHFLLAGVLDEITEKRRATAKFYDAELSSIRGIRIPQRSPAIRHVYHLYQVQVERRDFLLAYLKEAGIEAKVHYPRPLHLQPALGGLYGVGEFPVTEMQSHTILSLPIHEYLNVSERDYVVAKIQQFYREA